MDEREAALFGKAWMFLSDATYGTSGGEVTYARLVHQGKDGKTDGFLEKGEPKESKSKTG